MTKAEIKQIILEEIYSALKELKSPRMTFNTQKLVDDGIIFVTDPGLVTETRQGLFKWLIKKLPNFPEYVIRDWVYKMIKQSDDINTYEGITEWIEKELKDLKWKYQKNFPITMDIFTDKTKKELESRMQGKIMLYVDKDSERHETQKKLLQSVGISQEPIILFKTKDGKYELGEGWHRTTQTFIQYPDGFIQPNVYIGLNANWLN